MPDIDYGQILETLNDKTDTDLGNLSNAGKIVGSGLGMPSDTYDVLTLGASGSTYTAPANGWFTISANQTGTNGYIFMWGKSGDITSMSQPTNTNNFAMRVFVPIAKGKIIQVDYADIYVETFKFVYAEGSKSEQ